MSKSPEELIKNAEKILKKLFGDKQDKANEASELYLRAGNIYKINHDWPKAGDAYFRSAELLRAAGRKETAANRSLEASSAYLKDPSTNENSIKCLQYAINIFKEGNDTFKTGTLLRKAGDLFVKQNQLDVADVTYKAAIDCFIEGRQFPNAAGALEQQAEVESRLNKWNEAAELFEKAARYRLETPLTQTSAQSLFLRAQLCRLAFGDPINAKIYNDRFMETLPLWPNTIYGKFICDLIQAVSAQEEEKAIAAMQLFEQTGLCDPWTMNIFALIKSHMSGDSDLL